MTATHKEKRNLFSSSGCSEWGVLSWTRVRADAALSPLYAYVQTDSLLCGYVLRVGGMACSHSDVRTERSDHNRMLFSALRGASAFFSYNYFWTILSKEQELFGIPEIAESEAV